MTDCEVLGYYGKGDYIKTVYRSAYSPLKSLNPQCYKRGSDETSFSEAFTCVT